ncbi:MAG: hypothetical protein PHR53_08235 [Bacteroidales bacterium]|nr:hypothetical protein [Bacteroidales bacterium]
MNKTVKNVLIVVMTIVILVLAFKIYDSIMEPVRFNAEKDRRYSVVIQNLKDIREIQRYYKSSNGVYADNFNKLIEFAQVGEIPIVRMVPDPTDTTNTRSIKDTLGYVKVSDSLFSQRENFKLASIRYIPYTDNVEFEMKADTIEKSGVMVPVFEAKASNKQILSKGMEQYHQLLINLDASIEHLEKYPGLKVGSLQEVSLDGNWE